ncbi:hypothetical protein H2204_013067 [Knufia peltigerae]|uniref:Zn(2)-C6 fungal-type domain-containing protein n=1 Tax=Knufia peltigerae TaxID=1002370 RepID=A0AA39CSC8_9EURO|nr:hypothetical protein H2204_013067 [Knufia peltigerae]
MTTRVEQSSGSGRRLRTRTGCLTCRDRRKKCDERWPICSGCDRNLLRCCWRHRARSPDSGRRQHVSDSSSRQVSREPRPRLPEQQHKLVVASTTNWTAKRPELLPLTLVTAQTPGLRTALDHSLFAYSIDKLLPLMARPYVHPDYERFSSHLTVALHEPIVMDVLLASAAIHLSAGQSDKQVQALKYYSSAVRMLRQKIDHSEIDGTEDWLVLVAVIFCLFERWNTFSHLQASSHLLGAFQILKLRLANGKDDRRDDDLIFDRCLAESVIYHLSILPLFEGAQLTESVEGWQQLTQPLNKRAFPDLPQWANSPLLGGRPSLFRLIFDISRLRHGSHTKEDIRLLTWRLSDEDNLIRTRALTAWNHDSKDVCYRELRLFSTAAKVLLLKLTQPDLSAQHSSIQSLVDEALGQLTSWTTAGRFDQYFCWPLLVIGCAVTQPEHIEVIQRKLVEIWRCSRCGDAWRVRTVLEHAWARNREVVTEGGLDEAETTDDPSFSAFDVLLTQEGVFSLSFL